MYGLGSFKGKREKSIYEKGQGSFLVGWGKKLMKYNSLKV